MIQKRYIYNFNSEKGTKIKALYIIGVFSLYTFVSMTILESEEALACFRLHPL